MIRDFYKTSLLRIRRGNYRGEISNAKPLYLISISILIDLKKLTENRIYFGEETLKIVYSSTCILFNNNITPIVYPFYHLSSDEFYHLRWKGSPMKYDTPDNKLIRENVEYAYFDDELWNLLQIKPVREEYREAIIRHYLK